MNIFSSKIILPLAAILLLTGCVFTGRSGGPTPIPEATATPPKVITQATAQPTEIPSPMPTAAAAATPTGAGDDKVGAQKAAQEYAAALEAEDYAAAASLVSNFSLTTFQMSRGDVQIGLSTRASGGKWSGFQLNNAQVLSPQTVLIQVSYHAPSKDEKTGKVTEATVNELWPMRLENGAWRYNYLNLIDTRSLYVKEATYAGMTVKPLRMARFSDRIDLNLLVQNATNEAIVWGWPSETIATFHFGGQTVEGEKNRLIFDTLRSYPDTVISVKGLYSSYPDSVELRKFKTAQQPWFTFQLTE